MHANLQQGNSGDLAVSIAASAKHLALRFVSVISLGVAELAAAYDFGRPGYPSEAISVLAARLAPASTCRLLDVGAGNGMLTRGLLGIGRVIGVDPSAALLARLVSNTPSVPVARAVAEAMPFPDASFDALVASQSLHWSRPSLR